MIKPNSTILFLNSLSGNKFSSKNKFLLNEDDRKDMIYNMIENDEEKKEAINDMIENNTTENDDLSKRMEEFKRKMHIN